MDLVDCKAKFKGIQDASTRVHMDAYELFKSESDIGKFSQSSMKFNQCKQIFDDLDDPAIQSIPEKVRRAESKRTGEGEIIVPIFELQRPVPLYSAPPQLDKHSASVYSAIQKLFPELKLSPGIQRLQAAPGDPVSPGWWIVARSNPNNLAPPEQQKSFPRAPAPRPIY